MHLSSYVCTRRMSSFKSEMKLFETQVLIVSCTGNCESNFSPVSLYRFPNFPIACSFIRVHTFYSNTKSVRFFSLRITFKKGSRRNNESKRQKKKFFFLFFSFLVANVPIAHYFLFCVYYPCSMDRFCRICNAARCKCYIYLPI